MNALDKVLESQGLKYEDLNDLERETYQQSQLTTKDITTAELIDKIITLKNAVAMQLCVTPEDNFDLNCKLKARLNNYLVLEAFLTSPKKAREALERSLNDKS